MPDDESVLATAAWQRLEQALMRARSDRGLSASIAAIDAVCEFLKSVRPAGGEWLVTPLIVLNMAVAILPKGVVVPLLRPADPDGRPPDTFGRQQIKAYAAATVDLAALAMTADEHLSTAANAQKQPAGDPLSLGIGGTWTAPAMGAILPRHAGSQGVGHGVDPDLAV